MLVVREDNIRIAMGLGEEFLLGFTSERVDELNGLLGGGHEHSPIYTHTHTNTNIDQLSELLTKKYEHRYIILPAWKQESTTWSSPCTMAPI